jgi:hypothetical protein
VQKQLGLAKNANKELCLDRQRLNVGTAAPVLCSRLVYFAEVALPHCCAMQLWCKLSAFSILGAALVPLEKQTAQEKVNYAIQYLRAYSGSFNFCIFLSTGNRKREARRYLCLKSQPIVVHFKWCTRMCFILPLPKMILPLC